MHRPRVLHEEDLCNEGEQLRVSFWRLAICYGADHAADTLQMCVLSGLHATPDQAQYKAVP